jgi:hypothetical protein
MPDVREGLTTGADPGVATDESLDAQAQTREQTKLSHAPQIADDDAIRAGVLDDSTSLKAGLTRADDVDRHGNTQADRDRIRAEYQALRPELDALTANAPLEGDAAELHARRRAEVIEQSAFTFAVSEDRDEIAAAWLNLTPQERAQLVENGDVDAGEVPWLDQEAARAFDTIKGAAHAVADASRNYTYTFARQARWDALVAEQGWSEPRALAVLAEANAVALNSGVGGLANLDPADWEATVRGVAHARDAAVQAHEDARMKAEVFFAPDTDVRSGLEVQSADGRWVRTQPAPRIVARPDLSGVEAAMDGRTTHGPTDEEIKLAVGGEDAMTREYKAVQAKAAALFGEK